ncbi:MAG: aminodeoxychorismate synthase component I [Bacillota bacterium]
MTVLPLVEELPLTPDPVALFERIRHLRYPFLLESALRLKEMARYSFLSADPFLTLTGKDGRLEVGCDGSLEIVEADPFDALRKLLAACNQPWAAAELPFTGGAVGYFGYDLARSIEVLPSVAADDLGFADLQLGFYDVVVVVDHHLNRVYLAATGLPEQGRAALARARERIGWMRWALTTPKPAALGLIGVTGRQFTGFPVRRPVRRPVCLLTNCSDACLSGSFDPAGFYAVVEQAKDYIKAGDIFVINLAQRLSLPYRADPWLLYRRLREINPAPFAAYLKYDRFCIVSASPESFLRVRDGRVQTRPIKGTRPRGLTPELDERMRKELWHSTKDRAELAMVVDMLRSDLNKVCISGSVRVPDLYLLESYATVFQLVSAVEGRLEPGRDAVDLLRACFPGGSVTGAPKVRSMEIIEELEPVRRGVYTGAIGYLGFNGNADLSIVIRSVVCYDGEAYFHVGGGITIDSDPQAEYHETLDKARALLLALGVSRLEVDGWRL